MFSLFFERHTYGSSQNQVYSSLQSPGALRTDKKKDREIRKIGECRKNLWYDCVLLFPLLLPVIVMCLSWKKDVAE